MIYNLTVKNLTSNVSGALVSITRTSDSFEEFSGTTNASGLISATLTNSTDFTVTITDRGTVAKFDLLTALTTITTSYYLIRSLLTSFGITLDYGVIPPDSNKKYNAKLTSFGITLDYGTIATKNYFKTKMNTWGITIDEGMSSFIYEVL